MALRGIGRSVATASAGWFLLAGTASAQTIALGPELVPAPLNSQAPTSARTEALVTRTVANTAVVLPPTFPGNRNGGAADSPVTIGPVETSQAWSRFAISSTETYAAARAASPGTRPVSTISFQSAGSGSALNSCDLNSDGAVNVLDVQLITNMEIGASGFPCSANFGGVLLCTDSARQLVINTALGQGCHFITLNWGASPSSGVTGYNVYRGTVSGGESSTPLNTGGPVSGTAFSDTSTVSGTTYYYVVKATNGSAESGPSNEASATAQ